MFAKGQGKPFVISAITHLIRHRSNCGPDFRSLVLMVSSVKIWQDKSKSRSISDIYLGNARNSRLIGLKQLHGRTQLL